jgi:Vitamin K epoxide reductase family.
MFVTTLWLLYLQAFVLHAFCDYCLFSAGVTTVLTGIVIANFFLRERP